MPPQDQAASLLQQIVQQPMPKPIPLLSQPGIVRDGTRLMRQNYQDGVWCRFWQDRPRKMLGYREQVRDVNGVARAISIFTNAGYVYIHIGSTEALQRYSIDLSTGATTGVIDRTPAGYVVAADNLWVIDTIWQSTTSNVYAVAVPTLDDIADDVAMPVYTGDVLDTTALTAAAFTVDASTTGVALAQTLAGPGNLILNLNVTIPNGAGNISITTDANLTAVNFTITGTDTDGNPLVVGPTALPNTTTLDVGSQFSAISSVALDAGTGGNHVSVGWLAGSTALTTSGGLVAVGPYLFLYGHDGYISWNNPANPLDRVNAGSGTARPVPDKVVKGMPLRGSAAPAAIFWSLSSLIVANFVGGITYWQFSTVTTNGSILSQNAVVEHNGVYYWATTSGFSRFAGVMEDIPNEYNQQWFLDNLNISQRQKVFAYKVPRFREIWWCFPKGQSTECNHAVIYNYEKNYWYDTPLPNGGRGCGYYEDIFSYPIMSGVTENSDTGGTSMWQHEFGLDEVSGPMSTSKAILSYYETHEFTNLNSDIGQAGDNRQMAFSTIEPDYDQVGDLTLEIYSRTNTGQRTFSSPTDDTYPYVLPEPPDSDEENQTPDFKWTGRFTSFVIESNTLGGDYVTGAPLIHIAPHTGRRIG